MHRTHGPNDDGEAKTPEGAGRGRRILILDGDAGRAETLRRLLAEEEASCVAVSLPAHAEREAAEAPPDAVLVGGGFTGAGWTAFFERLKRLQAELRVPVLHLAREGREAAILPAAARPDDVLVGPWSRAQIAARLRSLLQTKALSDRLRLAYFHLDELGEFTERYAGEIVADWRPEDLAFRMASVLLSPRDGSPPRPAFIWGSAIIRGVRHGIACVRQGERWDMRTTRTGTGEVERLLRPFAAGDGAYLSNEAMPGRLRALLGVEPELVLPNFAAFFRRGEALLAAGYPWEVTVHDLPLLRASLRQWAVFKRIWRETRRTEEANFQAMEALALAAELHDPAAAGHVRRLRAYTQKAAEVLGQPPRFVRWIGQCAQLHDVGKISLPSELLSRPGSLSQEEWTVVRSHTVLGHRLLSGAPQLAMAARIARHHHENFDGSGYPDGLRGEEIPLEARVVKVADVYDALRTARPYKRAYTHEEALRVLREGDGRVEPSHFDPRVLGAFLDSHGEMARIFD
ncbi:MAG: HD domain-containing phosphohydrolase [Acidobacteriota bacterium]